LEKIVRSNARFLVLRRIRKFPELFAQYMACTVLLALANLCLGGWNAARFHHLVQTLIPVTACGLFTGLLALPAEQFRIDGIGLAGLLQVKWVLIPLSVLWSARLGYRVAQRYQPSRAAGLGSAVMVLLASAVIAAGSLGLLA
jgi:hypothetical protein